MTLASGIALPPERIVEICRRYKVRELAVFGSAAGQSEASRGQTERFHGRGRNAGNVPSVPRLPPGSQIQ